jgi:hypothetical protein
MYKQKRLPTTLKGISNLYSPEHRAQALLKLKSPNPYDFLFISLVQSVINFKKKGDAAMTLADRLPKTWSSPRFKAFYENSSLQVKSAGLIMPLVDRTGFIQRLSRYRNPEKVACILIEFGLWDEVGFSSLVCFASCSSGPQGAFLRAQALSSGIIERVTKSLSDKRP